MLAHLKVAGLDLFLRPLNRPRDHASLDDLAVFGPELIHDGGDALRAEEPHQVVLKRQVEARGTRVALASRAAAQLAVDAPRFVALGADDL